MKKTKFLLLSFVIASISTAILCIINGYPLIFNPVDYGISEFLRFELLILFLSFGLVYINLPVLKWLKTVLKLDLNPTMYFVVITILILQIFTMATGYYESLITRGVKADVLYYYKCMSNSCLYLFSGNLTSIVVAYLFGKEEKKLTTANNVYNA